METLASDEELWCGLQAGCTVRSSTCGGDPPAAPRDHMARIKAEAKYKL